MRHVLPAGSASSPPLSARQQPAPLIWVYVNTSVGNLAVKLATINLENINQATHSKSFMFAKRNRQSFNKAHLGVLDAPNEERNHGQLK